ncbi:hypothetical protein BXZ70DRAFT_76963 [Cristinia sonorae]|uniref:Uncharacterized protein n=1 Tax=Cristinia sonorae TaxID=1940300 RepID=A0A8K0UQP2_9AGAR|nr:hypothetical protein BXZ70DRAFT_76963 [Cristinia sonorae]
MTDQDEASTFSCFHPSKESRWFSSRSPLSSVSSLPCPPLSPLCLCQSLPLCPPSKPRLSTTKQLPPLTPRKSRTSTPTESTSTTPSVTRMGLRPLSCVSSWSPSPRDTIQLPCGTRTRRWNLTVKTRSSITKTVGSMPSPAHGSNPPTPTMSTRQPHGTKKPSRSSRRTSTRRACRSTTTGCGCTGTAPWRCPSGTFSSSQGSTSRGRATARSFLTTGRSGVMDLPMMLFPLSLERGSTSGSCRFGRGVVGFFFLVERCGDLSVMFVRGVIAFVKFCVVEVHVNFNDDECISWVI